MRALSAALALLGLLVACGGDAGTRCGPDTGRVVEVIDGDTVLLEGGERIRYLLADTPESTAGRHDCFGQEALAFNRSLVEGRRVTLVDAEACEDRFGRRLAYVTVDGHDVSALLVERGFACVLHVPPAGDSRRVEFEALEFQARRARRGLWGACSPVPCSR
ncbi:thermonuclease family protein [Myxococcus sp. CA051A]|uniref:thermonuclease family protein n=1 Tax=unclassified Myxococcus TaxID=2648731 RepID=UPI00157AB704|nr:MULTISPECIES: thermonuclease family protein [unclassified Myxococcus]NTX09917.1 thermonuclease family protein [Myxococcus sp. CA056]NTX35280.1 thermonuclease family protein [Myxococcus sp. CA033]NTX57089.1 thermonuclease family protein [Myxococcus sp. CA039A]NTX64379.1 thermonuclease family protein [Myxococcus sp. CA051A]